MKRKMLSIILALALCTGFAIPALAATSAAAEGNIAGGDNHYLAIKADNSLWAWGDNYEGELGDGTVVSKKTPVKIMDGVAYTSAGSRNSYAIKTDGSLWAWGNNWYGQIGDGTITAYEVEFDDYGAGYKITDNHDKKTPVKIMDGVASVATSTNGYTVFAIKTDGSLWGWGDNSSGQLGNGTKTASSIPVKILDNVASVASPERSNFAVKTDGSLWAWGK